MHLFVSCNTAKKCFDFIRQFLKNNELDAHFDVIQYKFKLEINDYKVISIYVYSIWQTRNILKHSNELVDAFNVLIVFCTLRCILISSGVFPTFIFLFNI